MQTSLPTAAERKLSPEAVRAAPLLLLLARERLDETQAELARRMAAGFREWRALAAIASTKLCLPFVHRHVAALELLPRDAPVRQAMHAATLQQAGRWLKIASEQRRFHETCLTPGGVPHLFVKGVTLARYYAEPGLRTCRDVDVLVEAANLDTVLDAAQAAGYRVLLDPRRGRFVQSARDLRAIRRYKKDLPLLSPDGTMIELHTTLDKDREIFDTADLLARAETAEVAGMSCRVMPTTDLAVYLAYHHNRHIWSSLHWLGDMGAILRHPAWSAGAARARAGELGLSEALEATLAFDALAGRPDRWADAPEGPARESLELCLQTLEGGPETEKSVYSENVHPKTNWRVPVAKRRHATREAWKARLTPNFEQYLAFPLPDWLHWLYPLEWAAGATKRLVTGQRNPFDRARMAPPQRRQRTTKGEP